MKTFLKSLYTSFLAEKLKKSQKKNALFIDLLFSKYQDYPFHRSMFKVSITTATYIIPSSDMPPQQHSRVSIWLSISCPSDAVPIKYFLSQMQFQSNIVLHRSSSNHILFFTDQVPIKYCSSQVEFQSNIVLHRLSSNQILFFTDQVPIKYCSSQIEFQSNIVLHILSFNQKLFFTDQVPIKYCSLQLLCLQLWPHRDHQLCSHFPFPSQWCLCPSSSRCICYPQPPSLPWRTQHTSPAPLHPHTS